MIYVRDIVINVVDRVGASDHSDHAELMADVV